jgi:iron(III) transport system substrate-binding protein
MPRFLFIFIILLTTILSGCFNQDNRQEIWIYTSLYKDTIADITPKLEKQFPHLKINWFQAGSEDIAAKINTEFMAGDAKADLLISSERFWYQELHDAGKLHNFKPEVYDQFYDELKNSEFTFHVASIPVMVIAYNSEAIQEKNAPKSFKDLLSNSYKGLVNGGSPLSSGTSFTTMAALQSLYGWDYFKSLKANNALLEGGNSAVMRRIQNKERPIGWVLLENVLRFQHEDARLKIVLPSDGAITQFNILAILKKPSPRTEVEKVANWIFSQQGQEAMIKSYMYSPIKNFATPQGAPDFKQVQASAFPWTIELIKKITTTRNELKDQFSEIMFK